MSISGRGLSMFLILVVTLFIVIRGQATPASHEWVNAEAGGVIRCDSQLHHLDTDTWERRVPYGIDVPLEKAKDYFLGSDGIGGHIFLYYRVKDGIPRLNITRQIVGHRSEAVGPVIPDIDVSQYDQIPSDHIGSYVRCRLVTK